MTFIVPDFVRDEIAGIARWYDSKPGRYGQTFLDEVEIGLKAIRENPRIHPPAEDGREGQEDREFLISRFKQRVVFTIEDDNVIVLSVIHASCKPGRWFLHRIFPSANNYEFSP